MVCQLFTDTFCKPVVGWRQGHITLVKARLFAENLYQTARIVTEFLVVKGLCEKFVIDGVAHQFPGEFDQMEQQLEEIMETEFSNGG